MSLSANLIIWYYKNARSLPWRKTKDPYLIWLSEIILQQTRVEQGLKYYIAFKYSFPDILSLSKASEDQVLKLWEGLGYYSRARNMMSAAKQIADVHQGVFPNTYEDIISLKGIGPYTAAAIASFSFGLPYAVVDGNVFRVLARYYDVDIPINSPQGKKYFGELAQEVLDKSNAATHNQAIMEFGALYCRPSNPHCEDCILHQNCQAYAAQKVTQLPVKLKKLSIKKRFLHFFFITDGNDFLLEKRHSKDIWKGLYQLPLIESRSDLDTPSILQSMELKNILSQESFHLQSTMEIQHKLSHRLLHIRFYYLVVLKIPKSDYQELAIHNIGQYAFPKPIKLFFDQRIHS